MNPLLEVKEFSDGIPPLDEQPTGSSGGASRNDLHEPANLSERVFCPLQDLRLERGGSIWGMYNARNNHLPWGSEKDIQTYVKEVIVSAIDAVGLKAELQCQEELSIFNVRPDIWIVTSNHGIPVGVIEVKKPDDSIMKDPVVHGQIYDYMLRLQSFYGIQNVFGVVTTYKQWRIYWFPQCDKIAHATNIDATITSNVQPTLQSGEEEEEEGEEEDIEDEKLKDKLKKKKKNQKL